MHGYLKEWLLDPRKLLCYRSKNCDLLLYTSSAFAPLSHGSSNVYSPGASYSGKVSQLFARAVDATGKFEVCTPTDCSCVLLALTSEVVSSGVPQLQECSL